MEGYSPIARSMYGTIWYKVVKNEFASKNVWEYIKNVQDGMVYSWGIVTPVLLFVTFVLILLALMAIQKDEQTVQSMDRLR